MKNLINETTLKQKRLDVLLTPWDFSKIPALTETRPGEIEFPKVKMASSMLFHFMRRQTKLSAGKSKTKGSK